MDERLLEEIGLTKGEIKVYLTLLKTGETTTGRIIEKAQISGGKIYIILDKLIKKGLVSFIIKEKTKYFSASTPKKILDYLDDKEANLQKKRKEIEEQLPSLLALNDSSLNKYDAKIYIGYNGIQTIIFDILDKISSKDEILIMGINLTRDEKYNLMWKRWHSQRVNQGISCKMLFSGKNSEFYKIFSKMNKTEARILEGITSASVGILKDNIILTTYGEEPSSIVIKHPEIVVSFTNFFNNLWKIAKR